ncbi:MAG: type 1 glutamine amidotransferase [Bdellovibrionaceae bacterium]|nr:type 1 glutamine amidotransferase [Pseudobdellovibrionaceae bacterium]
MAEKQLNGKRIAILATDGFEQSELLMPQKALQEAGAEVHVISLKLGLIRGWDEKNWGESVHVDMSLDDANSDDYDALMLPGGVINPDSLRSEKKAVQFVQAFVDAGKPIAAICHGPQTLVETGFLSGKKMTSYKSLKTDMVNAGAEWVDEAVVVDQGLITSRNPDDLPVFNQRMIEEFRKTPTAQERKPIVNRGRLVKEANPSLH